MGYGDPSYLDREGKIVGEQATDGPFLFASLVIGGLLIGVALALGSRAYSSAEDAGRSTDRVVLISFGFVAFGFLLMCVGVAIGGIRWWIKRGRGVVDPGRWFDIPPTPRSPDPHSQTDAKRKRRIHPLEEFGDFPQSGEDNADYDDDGDSD